VKACASSPAKKQSPYIVERHFRLLYVSLPYLYNLRMKSYNVSEAREKFAAIVKQAEAGETVELLRHGVAVVRVVPVKPTPSETLAQFRAMREGKRLGVPVMAAIEEGRRF
jgi:prevent-host-death family protein